MAAMKTPGQYYNDWENRVFGYGYGTGERYIAAALKAFLASIPDEGTYNYCELEAAVTPATAWLLINALCRADIIEYGTSTRFGWLTPQGKSLKAFIAQHSADDLSDFGVNEDGYVGCSPDYCNCDGEQCDNPFWVSRRKVEAA